MSDLVISELVNLLSKLISFKSLTPRGKDAILYVSNILENYGFTCDVQEFGAGEELTTNLYAFYGNEKPNICFAGHLDVVPAMNQDLWSHPPFTATIIDDKIYGRGAVDMKGALACSILASCNIIKAKPDLNGAISFLLTTDEEGKAEYGTQKMLEYIKDRYGKIDFCILGEPTTNVDIGDTVKIGRRGSINFTLKIHGKQGHVAYPEKAINPVYSLNKILTDLIAYKLDEGNEFFQSSNLEITSIDTGNIVTNIIPQSITIKFNIRYNTQHTDSDLIAIITDIVSAHSNDYDLKYHSSSKPFTQELSPNMQNFIDVVAKISKIKPSITTGGGTSDARFIYKFSEVLEFGLNANLAHKINEFTKISDLQTLYNVYHTFLNQFL
ncbi:MAG: succinyl-diaminopimelate desuccinylase [Rickettsiaceae bacterium]|nr:succinyl-diaminopimelate desuccinylase [Rickettsiaceae bacterium]